MSAACKYRPRCATFVWTFIVSGSLPLNLSDAQSFGVEQGEPERARNDTAIKISYARVQGREMQGVAFAQMSGVVGEVPGFASKPVMNFKILRVIHRHWPVGRRARRAEIEYFLMYLTGWPSCASTVLSLHFETDTRRTSASRAWDRVAFSLPETSGPQLPCGPTDWERIALFEDLLHPQPISGNVPHLFG
jgi:hypothetical protein